jgi:hypothetical protein
VLYKLLLYTECVVGIGKTQVELWVSLSVLHSDSFLLKKSIVSNTIFSRNDYRTSSRRGDSLFTEKT